MPFGDTRKHTHNQAAKHIDSERAERKPPLSGHVKDKLTQFVSGNRADKTAETDYQNVLHIGLRSRVSIGCGSLTPPFEAIVKRSGTEAPAHAVGDQYALVGRPTCEVDQKPGI